MKVLVTGGSGFIGTNLTQLFASRGIDFVNVDIAPPKIETLKKNWVNVDILNKSALKDVFAQFTPTAVVHLAAQTDTDPTMTIEDYRVNTEGSANVIDILGESQGISRFILTSTQFVNQSPLGPSNDQDYAPHTVYGESKIITEQYLRKAILPCAWTIIRPTNIWGPWHLRYPFEFWKVLAEGKYFHPGRQRVTRSYGYVGNVVEQIFAILHKPETAVNTKVFYVGDAPIDLYEWVNGFSIGQTGKPVRVVPRVFVFGLAVIGNLLKFVGLKFPITISRYKSMTTDNPAFMGKTFEELGPPVYSLEEGIRQTVEWLRVKHPALIKIKNG